LGVIGWDSIVQSPVELDATECPVALLTADNNIAEQLAGRPDGDGHEPSRDDGVQERERVTPRFVDGIERTSARGALAVPPMLVGLVREGAYGLLMTSGEAIVRTAQAHEESEPAIRIQLEHAWTLLGRLGWITGTDEGEVIELGIAEHGVALHSAIEMMIPLARGMACRTRPRRREPGRPRRSKQSRGNSLRLPHLAC
jgi:hypothetical protein